jgi:uncharacterized lipoprotein YddW (UPF0748 family)
MSLISCLSLRGLRVCAAALGIISLAASSSAFAQTPGEATPEVRAVWVASMAPGINSPEEIPATVGALREGNLNTLIAQVRRSGMVYFRSELEPRSTTITASPDFDPLADVLRVAHDTSGGEPRIDVYAWLNVFSVGNQESLRDAAPPPLSIAHPDWFSINVSGEVTGFLDPGVPAVEDHFAALVAECVRQYDVDGVNLDFVRYPEQGAGYNPVALERFHRLTGRTDRPAGDDPQWNDFQRAQVTAVVRRTMVTILDIRPEAMLSVCAVGFGGPPRPGQTFADTSPYRQVHQDWPEWVRMGIVDIVTRMGYKREHVPNQAQDFRGWAEFSRQLEDESGRPITLGIGGYFNQPEGVMAQYRVSLSLGLGTTLFSYHRPLGTAQEAERFGAASPLWSMLREQIYPSPAPPPRPVWREHLGTLAGVLRDQDENVVDTGPVSLVGTDLQTVSDGTGFFAFLKLSPGTYTISAPGRPIDGREVTVRANAVTWVSE